MGDILTGYHLGYTDGRRMYRCDRCWYRTLDPIDILDHLRVDHDPYRPLPDTFTPGPE